MQKSTPTSKSECDNTMNAQMNKEMTTPNSGTIPRRIPSPGTNNMTAPDNTNRRQTNETGTSAPQRTTPDTGMPMDRGTPPSTNIPMNRGATPRTGMPINRNTAPRTGMPMNEGMPPRTGMPMNEGMPPRTGMPMNEGMPPRTGMPMNEGMPPRTSMPPRTGMPMNEGMPPRTGMPMNNIFMPNNTPYNTPMGVPLYPLYGYENCEDLDRDMNYLKQLYPTTVKRIQNEVDNECDKLEYDGSVMFDEYPDKVTMDRIIDRVYENVKDMYDASQVETNSLYNAPRRRQNLLRDVINIILLNEIFNRRRRHRSRRRWF